MSRSKVRRALVAAMLVVLAVRSVRDARAEGELAGLLASGDDSGAATLVATAASADALRSDPAALAEAARAAAVRACAPRVPAALTKVAAFLVESGEAALKAAPESAEAQRAVGWAIVARERMVANGGAKTSSDAWLRAADLLDKTAGTGAEADETRAAVVRFLIEGAACSASQQQLLGQRATAIVARAVKDRAADARIAWAKTLLDAAREIVTADRKTARDVSRAAFETVRPVHDGEKSSDEVASAWNDLVSWDRATKFGLNERYVQRREDFLSGFYTVDVPAGGRFTSASQPPRGTMEIRRKRSDGVILSTLWWRNFYFTNTYDGRNGKGLVSGDNPQAISDATIQEVAKTYVPKESSRKEPKKGRVGQGIAAHIWEVAGKDANDQPIRVRGWTFRGANQMTWELIQFDTTGEETIDPETQAILDSLREK